MRVFALVLIVAVAAFFLGRWSVPRPPKERASAVRPPVEPYEPVAPPAARERVAERAPRKTQAPETPRPPLVRTRQARREGHGLLELRGHRQGEGFEELNVLKRDIDGAWGEMDLDFPEEGPLYVDLEHGPYRVSAHRDDELGMRLYRIGIRTGETVVVDLAAPPTPELFPLPEGLGRVDVRVVDVAGAPLSSVGVALRVQEESVERNVNDRGWARFEVLPGTYRIVAGAVGRNVTVEAGREVRVRLDGAEAAELTIAGPHYAQISLGSLDHDTEWDAIGQEGSTRHVLLAPGRYEVACYLQPRNRKEVLETVTLAAGDRFRIAPESSGVFVRFECRGPNGHVRLPPGTIHVENTAGAKRATSGKAVLYERGEYTARLDGKEWVADTVRFRVDREPVVVILPVRKR